MTYILCHGFGFTNDYWKHLIPYLDDSYTFWDENFQTDPQESYVGIGHSLGFLKLNKAPLKWKALIGLQGFLSFCEGPQRDILKVNVDRLMEAFSKNPKNTLKFFYTQCGYTGPVPQSIDPAILLQDLQLLKIAYPHRQVPTLILGSDQDKIVSLDTLKANFEHLPQVQLNYIHGVSHVLGYEKPKETFAAIQKFLSQLHAKGIH